MSAEIEVPPARQSTAKRVVRGAVLLAGSMFLGSAALALWNRRALRSIREASEASEEPSRLRDEDGIY